MKRHFLMLAEKYDSKKHSPIGWFISEKLDGMRCFWDGGVTRGKELTEVPWANTLKDSRYVTQPVATGLWTRYGKSIQAPDWWLDELPKNLFLDGELYMGRNCFQPLMSTVKKLIPGSEWQNVKYLVFDTPPVHTIFANGIINETNFKKEFRDIERRVDTRRINRCSSPIFRDTYYWLKDVLPVNDVIQLHRQEELCYNEKLAKKRIDEALESVCSSGGEGLMLRAPGSYWVPSRSKHLLKVKALHDAEAIVVGYIWGKETDLGSKLLGKMGALIVNFQGKQFELSGFTDEERELSHSDEGVRSPGKVCEPHIFSRHFPRGSRVSFKYRELSDEGIPKEARYWRKHLS